MPTLQSAIAAVVLPVSDVVAVEHAASESATAPVATIVNSLLVFVMICFLL
jgi:hypothetical protein